MGLLKCINPEVKTEMDLRVTEKGKRILEGKIIYLFSISSHQLSRLLFRIYHSGKHDWFCENVDVNVNVNSLNQI